MAHQEKDTYFVAIKLFLKRDGKLLILKDNFGDWDLPGGRIKPDEFETSLESILRRKIKEELGTMAEITIGALPVVFMRHERVEQAPGNPTVRIFALGYEGKLTKGDVTLSPRHTEMLWVDPNNFQPEQYFSGGWLKGMKEYIRLHQ
ncbi:MAG TPA: NUDIX domain-containing protein [Candidatus Peribacteraceae bacterium]|nr:NUDIX domain-containing protein [Candidatus Peribacteraceae bacterium]